jgi:hypothetical protein
MSEIQPKSVADLHELARALRSARRLSPEVRQELADFLEALDAEKGATPTPEMNRLTDKAKHLLESLHHERDAGVLAAARNGVEKALLRVEDAAPVTAGALRRFLDALASIGI